MRTGSFQHLATRHLFLLLAVFLWMGISTANAKFFGLLGNPRVDVSGFGFFGNIHLERSLEILDPEGQTRETLDATYVEDALWILSGEIAANGYLNPTLDVTLVRDGNVVWQTSWNQTSGEPPPDDLEADRLIVRVRPGTLYYFETIHLDGMPADFDPEDTPSFFYATDRLIVNEADRYYTPGRAQAGVRNVLQYLRDRGFRQARMVESKTEQNDETGAVHFEATFETGLRYFVRQIRIVTPGESTVETLQDQVFTPAWFMNRLQEIRQDYQSRGYPKVKVEVTDGEREAKGENLYLDLVIQVTPGPFVTLGEVNFAGDDKTSPALLQRQADLQSGAPLDIRAAERGRDRIAKLNIFQKVRLEYDEAEEDNWNVVYELTPKPTLEVSLIAGVGSYDIVRGGIELAQNNLWGLAHRTRLVAVQSFKSTSADYTYSIPQLLGEDVDFFAKLNYLNRKEISFTREEYGFSAGLQRYFHGPNIGAALLYKYQLLDARKTDFRQAPGTDHATASSIELRLTKNELDNPLYPTNGYLLFGTFEVAFPQLGGQVEYQRIEIGGAYHVPIAPGLVLHTGLKHGIISTFGPVDENIPVNKRFFLGGENTVRGYRRGQASPVNPQGAQIGAATYMLLQVEFEQRLTQSLSLVAFVDTVGIGSRLGDYPFSHVLCSAGGGLSIRTPVGPLRFEYGQNLNPRTGDPNGTFQVAIGFPF